MLSHKENHPVQPIPVVPNDRKYLGWKEVRHQQQYASAWTKLKPESVHKISEHWTNPNEVMHISDAECVQDVKQGSLTTHQ
jgi:hypothetical protein